MSPVTRRDFLKAGSTALTAILAGCGGRAAEPPTETWRMFGNDAARTGRADTNGPAKSPSVAWTHRTHGSFESSPVVANGTVYVGGADRTFYALDADDGSVQWTANGGSEYNAPPAVTDGTVYVGNPDYNVYSYEADGGIPVAGLHLGLRRWTTKLGSSVVSAPAVVDGTVYVQTTESVLVALDSKTGRERWSKPAGGNTFASPAVADGTVFVQVDVGAPYQQLRAVATESGDQRWSFDHGKEGPPSYSTPAVRGGIVVFGSTDESVYAVDAKTGDERWHVETDEVVYSSPAIDDDTVYIPSWDGYLYALDPSDGTRRWRAPYAGGASDRDHPVHPSAPTVDERTVYLGTSDGLHAFRKSTGEHLWHVAADGPVTEPAIGDGKIYAQSRDGVLRCVE